MSKCSHLTMLTTTTLVTLMGIFEAKAMPLRVYHLIQTTILLIGTTSTYDGLPTSSIAWFY